MDTNWVPSVNNLKQHSSGAFDEFTGMFQIRADFGKKFESEFNRMIESFVE